MKTLQDIRRKRLGDDRHALVEGWLLCRRIRFDAGGLSLVTAGGCSSAEVSSQDVSLGLVSCATPSWHNDHSQDFREVRSQDSQACSIRRNPLQAEFYKMSGCDLILSAKRQDSLFCACCTPVLYCTSLARLVRATRSGPPVHRAVFESTGAASSFCSGPWNAVKR